GQLSEANWFQQATLSRRAYRAGTGGRTEAYRERETSHYDSPSYLGYDSVAYRFSGMPPAGVSIVCPRGLEWLGISHASPTFRYGTCTLDVEPEECLGMPTIDQLSKLFKAIASKDFLSSEQLARQIAAEEEKKGHRTAAQLLKG